MSVLSVTRVCSVMLLALCACAGTETGNPSFVGTLGYDAYTSAPAVVALSMALAGPADALLTVDNAWLVLGDVELQSGAACGATKTSNTANVHDVPGLGAGDHANGQAAPTEFESTVGKYCGLRLPLTHAGKLPAGAPDSLAMESVLLRGKLPDGRSFEVHSQLQESLSLRATAGEFVLDSAHAAVVIGFDVAHWLGALNWQDATATADASVVVSESSNRALLEQFEAALPGGIALFRDRDGDGELDREPTELAAASDPP